MRISISWSGNLSYKVAVLLSKWLPSVVQAVTPFVSTDVSRKGSAWFKKVKDQFNQTDFGIICLSRDNLNAPWLLFETGVLATRFDQVHICTVLIGDLSDTDITGPLHNFQSIKLKDKEDIRKLIQTLNQLHGTRMSSANALNSAFDRRWPIFEDACKKAIKKEMNREEIEKSKSEHQLLEEINGLCVHLVEAMGTMSSDIKDMKHDLIKQNIISFPQKEVRKN